MSIVVTGATGNLGGLAVDALLRRGVEPDSVIAVGRNPEQLHLRAELGVQSVAIDYQDRDSLRSAFQGADKLLLVSSSELGQRAEQHRNVVESAAQTGVELLVYTSILRADSATQLLAKEHQATEELLASSGVPHVLLRNGWYFENYTSQIPSYLDNGAIVGAAGEGRISGATREDYAEAAAAVLTNSDQAGAVYELGGDRAFSMAEFAAALSRQARRDIDYRNLGVDEYAELLISFGLPEPAARTYADGDRAVADGELYVDTGDLSRLIGRPTTPLSEAISAALDPVEVPR